MACVWVVHLVHCAGLEVVALLSCVMTVCLCSMCSSRSLLSLCLFCPPFSFPLSLPPTLFSLHRLFLQIILYLEAVSAGATEGLDSTSQASVCVGGVGCVCVCMGVWVGGCGCVGMWVCGCWCVCVTVIVKLKLHI